MFMYKSLGKEGTPAINVINRFKDGALGENDYNKMVFRTKCLAHCYDSEERSEVSNNQTSRADNEVCSDTMYKIQS